MHVNVESRSAMMESALSPMATPLSEAPAPMRTAL
eukprot:SAG11_NODE_38153_length_253_cov_1.383117_1_plen_34_part_01